MREGGPAFWPGAGTAFAARRPLLGPWPPSVTVTIFVIVQGIDDLAIGDMTALALAEHALEFGLQRLQPGDLQFNGHEMPGGNGIDFGAVAIGPVGQAQERSYISKLEAKRPRVADEGQPRKVRGAIVPVIARRSRWGRQQALLLVEANGFGLGAGLPC